jgi:hypothetical protein
MATFGQWFLAQSGRGDQVGYAAKAWRDAKRKPRASAPQTITNFLLADPDQVPELGKDEIEAAMAAAVGQYHEGNHHVGPAVPRPPLASVPDSPVSAGEKPAEAADGGQVMAAMDERLAGIQELVAERHDVLHEAIGRVEKRVADLHELYFAFLQASQPLLQLAAELQEGGEKIGSMRAEATDGDAPQSLSDQLGFADADLADSRPPMATPAQLAAQQVAQRNGWLPGDGELVGPDTPAGQVLAAQQFEAPGRKPPNWAGGLCEIHCREDRCAYGCDCPGHKPDGTHVTQSRPGLYGAHAAPEPTQAQWRAWHEAGE